MLLSIPPALVVRCVFYFQLLWLLVGHKIRLVFQHQYFEIIAPIRYFCWLDLSGKSSNLLEYFMKFFSSLKSDGAYYLPWWRDTNR